MRTETAILPPTRSVFKPLALAAVLFVWLVCGGFAINAGITALLN